MLSVWLVGVVFVAAVVACLVVAGILVRGIDRESEDLFGSDDPPRGPGRP